MSIEIACGQRVDLPVRSLENRKFTAVFSDSSLIAGTLQRAESASGRMLTALDVIQLEHVPILVPEQGHLVPARNVVSVTIGDDDDRI